MEEQLEVAHNNNPKVSYGTSSLFCYFRGVRNSHAISLQQL